MSRFIEYSGERFDSYSEAELTEIVANAIGGKAGRAVIAARGLAVALDMAITSEFVFAVSFCVSGGGHEDLLDDYDCRVLAQAWLDLHIKPGKFIFT